MTDLDNTLWRGVIAEDGLTGIAWNADGVGYRHFVYQTYPRRLRAEGVLLAAVSRNSLDVALAPLLGARMVLAEKDFVAVVASYHAKSAQIRELARQLNVDVGRLRFRLRQPRRAGRGRARAAGGLYPTLPGTR